MKRIALVALVLTGACSDALEQHTTAGQYVGLVTADNYLMLVSATDLTQRLVQLESGTGSGQRLTARGSVFLASIGGSARVDVVDLAGNPDSVGRIGLGFFEPIDAAMADDSTAWVATTGGYVAHVNYRTHALGNMVFIGGSGTPTAVAVTARRVFVIEDAGLSSPGFIAVVDPVAKAVVDTVLLTPPRPRLAVVGDDSLLYVVSDRAGSDSGRVSVVDPVGLKELLVINGLATAPTQAVFHPAGRLLVASGFAGVQEVNTLTKTLSRGPSDAVRPNGQPVFGLAIDERGRIYAADNNCEVAVLSPPPDYAVRHVVTVSGLHCPGYAAVAAIP